MNDIATETIDREKFFVDLLINRIPKRFSADDNWFAILTDLRFAYHRLYPRAGDDYRVLMLMQLMAKTQDLAAGDYVEMGTLHGGTARIIWKLMRLMRPEARLYVFDTFTGFPERDVDAEDELVGHNIWRGVTFDSVTPEVVTNHITDRQGDHPSLVMVPGRVPDTLVDYEHLTLRFVHLDMDLALPTASALLWAWPRLVPGGIIVCHDYDYFASIRVAVDPFCAARGLPIMPIGDVYGSVVIIKPPLVP